MFCCGTSSVTELRVSSPAANKCHQPASRVRLIDGGGLASRQQCLALTTRPSSPSTVPTHLPVVPNSLLFNPPFAAHHVLRPFPSFCIPSPGAIGASFAAHRPAYSDCCASLYTGRYPLHLEQRTPRPFLSSRALFCFPPYHRFRGRNTPLLPVNDSVIRGFVQTNSRLVPRIPRAL